MTLLRLLSGRPSWATLVLQVFLTRSARRACARASSSPPWLSVSTVVTNFTVPLLLTWRPRLIGESGLGKSTLVNTLFNTQLYPPKEQLPPSAERPQTVAIESISAGMSQQQNSRVHHLTLYNCRYRGERRSSASHCCRYSRFRRLCKQRWQVRSLCT